MIAPRLRLFPHTLSPLSFFDVNFTATQLINHVSCILWGLVVVATISAVCDVTLIRHHFVTIYPQSRREAFARLRHSSASSTNWSGDNEA